MLQLLYQMSFSGFAQVIVKTYFPTRVCLLLSKMCLMKLRIPSCVVIYVVWFVFYGGECMIMWKKAQEKCSATWFSFKHFTAN